MSSLAIIVGLRTRFFEFYRLRSIINAPLMNNKSRIIPHAALGAAWGKFLILGKIKRIQLFSGKISE